MVTYRLVPTDELHKDPALNSQFGKQLADYRKETEGEMVVFPGSHLYAAEEGGKLVAWTLGHPAMAGKVFEGEKSFVPVAEYVAPGSRGKVQLKPYYINMVDSVKSHGFDFFHIRPDMPFMVTGKGEKIIQTRNKLLREKRGLKDNEGSVGDNILCFDADKVDRILGERARQAAETRAAARRPSEAMRQKRPASLFGRWFSGFRKPRAK